MCQCMTNIWVQKHNRLPNFAEHRICASFDAEATRHTRYLSNSKVSAGGWEQLMDKENEGRENYNAGGGVLIGEEESEGIGKNIYVQYRIKKVKLEEVKEDGDGNDDPYRFESLYYVVKGDGDRTDDQYRLEPIYSGVKGDGYRNDDQDPSKSIYYGLLP